MLRRHGDFSCFHGTVRALRHIIRAATYNKNDAADAEAITEAAERPTMHFVAVKTEAQQAQGMLFRTRDLLVRQRTQTINALRGHLAEYGVVAPQGRARIRQLIGVLEDGDCGLPEAVVELGRLLLRRIDELDEKIDGLDRKLRASERQHEETARLMTIPGIGPITALAIQAFAPPMEGFRRGRDFSAWVGLVPRQHTTGGKPRLGRISKMGQRIARGRNPGRKSPNYIQDCTICVSCRHAGPCWTVPRKREKRLEWRDSRARAASFHRKSRKPTSPSSRAARSFRAWTAPHDLVVRVAVQLLRRNPAMRGSLAGRSERVQAGAERGAASISRRGIAGPHRSIR